MPKYLQMTQSSCSSHCNASSSVKVTVIQLSNGIVRRKMTNMLYLEIQNVYDVEENNFFK